MLLKTTVEREVLVSETITIEDYQGDTLKLSLDYDSTVDPVGGALIQFDITDKGERGTWITPDELEEMAKLFVSVASAIRVAQKEPLVNEKPVSRYRSRSILNG